MRGAMVAAYGAGALALAPFAYQGLARSIDAGALSAAAHGLTSALLLVVLLLIVGLVVIFGDARGRPT